MKKLFVIIALQLPVYLTAQLKINEIMPNNVSAVMDETYNYSMWVEVYNSGTSSTNAANYYFSDDITNLKKWEPSSKTINAKGYSVLWFERNDLSAQHCTFKLAPEGGVLYLSNFSGVLLDSVSYPAQFRNVSYGRETDGADNWVFFEDFSPGLSNNNKKSASVACDKPVFKLAGGFYSSNQTTGFNDPLSGDTIYYTANGSEPTRLSTRYTAGQSISIIKTSIIRARTFSGNKLPSEISTMTYFIRERNFNLPVVSIVTEQKNLTDNTIGIYVVGTNGIPGNGTNDPTNCNQLWDRPANIEIFDVSGKPCMNQELDICLSGGWSRNIDPQKSLQLNPKKKFGDNKLEYDVFSESKPGHKYKSIQFRNSGNDFFFSMMRDGFMHALVANRLNMDYSAYKPAVCFMNGAYNGIQNLQERSSYDYVYSNYGLSQTEISLLDNDEMPTDPVFKQLLNYVNNNDITKADVYNQAGNMMDIDNFMSYFISEIYWNNTDWPNNNMKVWEKLDGGKWRWILYDTDFGFNLYDDNGHYNNTLTYTFGFTGVPACVILNRLLLNDTFKNKFIDRFCIQLSSTFGTQRVNQVMDSMANMISSEIVYHKNRWGSYSDFSRELTRMKTFSSLRPDIMLGFIGSYFLNSAPVRTINISSNIDNASYIFNTENIIDNEISLKSFMNRTITLEPNPNVKGYKFNHWEIQDSQNDTLIPMNSVWKYWDKNGIPAANWNTSAYNDASWQSGPAQLGYGDKQGREATVLSYGPDPNNKYPTAYFRKTFTISDLTDKNNFEVTIYVDDGAAVYINGTEVGRFNLPAGTLTFNTYTTTWNDGEYAYFSVPKSLLKEGDNLIAAEVHQTSGSSSDLIFNASLACSGSTTSQTIDNPVFTTVLKDNMSIKAVFDDDGITDPNADAKVFINEIVASNSLYKDEYGNKSDYAELYNAGETNVNIADWYISDSKSNPTLCQIPTTDSIKTNIPAKGRINIWFDKQPELGVLHVSKGLSKAGETVILSRRDPWGNIITMDKVTFPALDKNMSYSRVPDGSDNWVIQPPTFNLPNGNPASIINPDKAGFKVYPTVVNDYITVEHALNKQIKICDLTGRTVINTVCRSEKETVRLDNLHKGIYMVRVENSALKIVKQ